MVCNVVQKANRVLRDWERVDRGMVCVLGMIGHGEGRHEEEIGGGNVCEAD